MRKISGREKQNTEKEVRGTGREEPQGAQPCISPTAHSSRGLWRTGRGWLCCAGAAGMELELGGHPGWRRKSLYLLTPIFHERRHQLL